MIRETVTALIACLVTFILCAVIYPVVVWGLARVGFPHQANGSLILDRQGNVIGSELVAQPFASDRYFHPRPSAVDYKADASGGSNLGPGNPDLRKKIGERARALNSTSERPAPTDLVMASGSGLDPHISPEAAEYQLPRVATARGLSQDRLRALINAHTERSGATVGAPPRINVLKLNMALDGDRGPDEDGDVIRRSIDRSEPQAGGLTRPQPQVAAELDAPTTFGPNSG
jgi:K+-transporting ATPase ATPase C chain